MSRSHRVLISFIVLAACLGPSCAVAAPTTAPASGLAAVLEALLAEGTKARTEATMPTSRPDFAARWDGAPPDDAELAAALRRQTHPDPFVDAYVRWQLISFEPTLGTFQDDEFVAFIKELPRLQDSPLSSMRRVRYIDALMHDPDIIADFRPQVEMYLDELQQRIDLTDVFGRPARELRTWIDGQVAPDGLQRILWLTAWTAHRIQRGWSPAPLDQRLGAALAEPSVAALSAPERIAVADEIAKLGKLSRRRATFFELAEDGTFEAEIVTTRIDPDLIETWIERLTPDAAE